MIANFKTLLHNNMPLSLFDRERLIGEYDYLLETDDIFTRAEVAPMEIAELLRNYGWFWLSIEKDPAGNGDVSELVVVDISNVNDAARASLQYYDTRLGEMVASNFTDFVQRVKQGNKGKALGNAVVRLSEGRFEGAKSRKDRFPGFPAKPFKKLVVPTQKADMHSFTKLYKDFLYHSSDISFACYLYTYLEAITDMSLEEKGKLFEEMVYYNFNTVQESLRIQENCVLSTKYTLFKLMGLLPRSLKVKKFEKNPRLPNDSPRSTYVADYDTAMRILIEAEMGLSLYEFTSIFGMTGANSLEPTIYKTKLGYSGSSRAGRRAALLKYMNDKMLPFLQRFSPHKWSNIQLRQGYLHVNDKKELHDFIVKIGNPQVLYPVGLEVRYNARIYHFITLVYNPFNDTLLVLDPLPALMIDDQNVYDEQILRITIEDDNGYYTWKGLDERYPKINNRFFYSFE